VAAENAKEDRRRSSSVDQSSSMVHEANAPVCNPDYVVKRTEERFPDGITKPIRPEGVRYKMSIPNRFVKGLKDEAPGTDIKRWQQTQKWREENNVDAILDQKQPQYFSMRKYYTSFYHGRCSFALNKAKGFLYMYNQSLLILTFF
jgi:hypothetical protein